MNEKFTTVNALIEKGIPAGLFWNTSDKNKPVEVERAIVYTLKKGFNSRILNIHIDIFGKSAIKKAIKTRRGEMSERTFSQINKFLL